MAKIKIVHVAPGTDGWRVTQDGKQVSVHRTQHEAIKAGRRKVEGGKGELITHGRDGRIRFRDSSVLATRTILEPPGRPSVSRNTIAAAARAVVRAEGYGAWVLRSPEQDGVTPRPRNPAKGGIHNSRSRILRKHRAG